jgi:hypothetical protein
VLGGDQKFAAEGGFAGTTGECFFGADASDIGVVIVFRKMGQDEVAGTGVEAFGIGQKSADHFVREVAGAAHHTLLDVPGIRADLEHFEIVIGFEDHAVAIAQVLLHEFRHVAEIGNQSEFYAAGAKGEAERIDGVVWNTERRHFNIAHGKSVASLDEFNALKPPRMFFREKTQHFRIRFRADIDRRAPSSEQRGEAANVVGMFVGDDDAVEVVNGIRKRGQAAEGFAFTESGIHQEARPGSFEQGAIAGTARRENAHAKADGFSPECCNPSARKSDATGGPKPRFARAQARSQIGKARPQA